MSWQDDPVVTPATPQVDDKLMNSVRQTESGGNANAVSPKGAIGPYQFMPAAARDVGLSVADAKDESKARPAAQKYLQGLVDKTGSIEKGLAAYNWGLGNVEKHGIDKAPAETKAYVKKVMAGMSADSGKAPWENDPIVGGKTEAPKGGLVESMKPAAQAAPVTQADKAHQILQERLSTIGRVNANIDSLISMALATPGMVAGAGADLVTRLTGAMQGADRRTTAQKAQDNAQFASELVNGVVLTPIQKLMRIGGYGNKDEYAKSDVDTSMARFSQLIGMGGEKVEQITGGLLLKEDVQSLVNEGAALGAIKGMQAGPKAGAVQPRAAEGTNVMSKPRVKLEDVRRLRVDPAEAARPNPNDSPQSLAQKHVTEATQNAAQPTKMRIKLKNRQVADARENFIADPEYVQYLDQAAKGEATQRVPQAPAADTIDVATKGEMKTPVTGAMAEAIMKVPGKDRTPSDMSTLRQFNRQGGKMNPTLLAKMAAVGLGIAGGVYLDPQHPIEGGLLGLGAVKGAAMLAHLGPKAAGAIIGAAFKEDPRLSISDLADTFDHKNAAAAREIWQAQDKIISSVPDVKRREAITNWMQGDKSIPLSQKEHEAALSAREYYDGMLQTGRSADVLHHALQDYVTNLWDLEGSNKGAWAKLQGNGMSTKSRFDLGRKIGSLAEGKKLGLKPITEDIAAIMGIYGNSLMRTIHNKQLIESLKASEIAGSTDKLIMSAGDAPKNYQAIAHPQMNGNAVHPDIASSMNFLFQQKSPSGIMAGLEGLNTAVKRLEVSFSLFHAKALSEAFVIGNWGNPFKVVDMLRGSNKYLQMLKTGKAGDMVDTALEGGLKITYPKRDLAVEDEGGSFYNTLGSLHKFADEMAPHTGLGKAIGAGEVISHALDTITWERLHTGMKLEVFGSKFETLRRNNIAANAKNPEVALKTQRELAKIASSYTNDMFGGLNWRMVAEASRTKWGKDLSMEVLSPKGRRTLQLVSFAPDWTLSTVRAATQALRKGTGLKGLVRPQELADLHRQYLIRNALFYFTALNGVNYATSGHFLWDNEDPTMLDLGDGIKMQAMKHAMEPVDWLIKPLQEGANKLGIMPRELINQASGKEYINTAGKAPSMDTSPLGRVRHMAKSVVPIGVQGKDNATSAIASALGFPTYKKSGGQNKGQRQEESIWGTSTRKKKANEWGDF